MYECVNLVFASISRHFVALLNTRQRVLCRMGNNPMVGATVAVAVSIEEAAKAGKF